MDTGVICEPSGLCCLGIAVFGVQCHCSSRRCWLFAMVGNCKPNRKTIDRGIHVSMK
jgi:hypothetical protein